MNKHTIEDTSIVAFLALRGHHFKPFKQTNGRIAFEISGDCEKDLQELYANPTAPLLDYIKWLKTVRSSIFTLKEVQS